MIRVTVLYPNTPGGKFDMAYYCGKHIPLVRKCLVAALKGVTVEEGIAGDAPGTAPAFVAIAQLAFDSAEAFQTAFAPHEREIMGDIPHYTNIQPTIQISEVKM